MPKINYPGSAIAQIALTLLVSAIGAGAFWLLNLPLPFLFGPMFGCLAMALLGMPLKGVSPAETLSRTILGVAAGASITPETLSLIPSMAASLALVPLYVAAIGAVGVPYFRKVCGYDKATAWYAAMPGGLVEMVQFGSEAGANIRSLSLIHATRVTIFITVAPAILLWAFGASLNNPPGPPAVDIPIIQLALMAFAALAGWKLASIVGMFGATILGPMIIAALLSLTGFIHNRPPAEAIIFAQFFLGTGVGAGYVALSFRELRKDVLAGMGFVVIIATLAVAFAQLVARTTNTDAMAGFLAFAPAGQAEMTMLAIAIGADLGFVITHHLLRMIFVVVGAPVTARLSGIKAKHDSTQ